MIEAFVGPTYNILFFFRIILFIYYMCLIAYLCVWIAISGFLGERGILVIFRIKGILVIEERGKLVILEWRVF